MINVYVCRITLKALSLIFILGMASDLVAQNSDKMEIEPKRFVSDHRISADGKTIHYNAAAGETILRNEAGEPTAAIWSTSYIKKGSDGKRPVVFVFNGGPGAAAAGMQMGFLGPKIVSIPGTPQKDDGAAPYALIDNPNSILDLTDIVFVDPVGTGYSRAIGSASNVDFWNMAADTKSMADFIHAWVANNQRWNSPKYILGLSYGTTRGVMVANHLVSHSRSLAMNGLILHGPALDFIGLSPLTGNMISYLAFMPTMAAVAHHHGKAGVGKSLEDFVEEARQFNAREYAPALALSGNISDEEKQQVAERFAYFTGLSTDFVLKSDLKVVMPRFRKELLRSEGFTVGLSDGRYLADEYDDLASDPMMPDPTSFKTSSANYTLLNHYITSDLGVKMDRPYEIWNPNVGKHWQWKPDLKSFSNPKHYRIAKRTGHIEVLSLLSSMMRLNQDMKVLVGTGYFDLVTPFFDAERVFTDNRLPAERVDIKYYSGGHRMWLMDSTRKQLVDDIRTFLTSSN